MADGSERSDGKERDFSDTVSVGSTTTKTSTVSKLSKFSFSATARVSQAASGVMKRFSTSSRSASRSSTSSSQSELVDLQKGDMCETIALVTVRRQESLQSDVLAELPAGVTLDLLEVGEGRRIKVAFGTDPTSRQEGWVSSKTKHNEPLVMKCNTQVQLATMDLEVGGQHEIKARVTVRAGEELDSAFVAELPAGTRVSIVEVGTKNKRRVKVSSSSVGGWISTATKVGEPLMGKVDDPVSRPVFSTNTGAKVQALLEAARAGQLQEIQKLADGRQSVMGRFMSKPSLNGSDVRGKTPLIYASTFGHKDVVKYLLSRKEVDVNYTDDTQKAALHHAAKGHKKRKEALLATGAPEDTTQGEIVRMILDAGADMEARDHNGCTALMFAAANGDGPATQELLKSNANVNVKDFEGHRPLDYAMNYEHEHIVAMLRAAGAVTCDYVPQKEAAAAAGVSTTAASASTTTTTTAATEVAEEPSPGASPTASPAQSSEVECASPTPASPKRKSMAKKKSTVEEGASEGKPKAKAKVKAKSKAGAKGHAKAKKPTSGAMMEALAEEDDTSKSVKVEEMPTEDVEGPARALAKLAMVVDSEGSPGELEAAIKAARREGAEDKDLVQALAKLEVLKAKFAAREDLRQATRLREVAPLQAAIRKAKDANVEASAISEAEAILAEELPRQKARDELRAAEESGDTKRLQKAVEAGRAAKLDPSELKEFEELLAGAQNKEAAKATLQQAMDEKNVPALKFAISQAKEAGVAAEEIQKAEAILKVEEPKMLARKALEEACEQCTKDALAAAIAQAKAAGLAGDEYAEAAELLKNEELKEQLLAKVKQSLQDSMAANMADIDAVKAAKDALGDAIKEAISVGVSETYLMEAELRRKKLHNTVEDLKGSIRVFARIRPLSSKETDAGDHQITKQLDLMTLNVTGEESATQFKFDAVFTPGTQDEIFEDCKDLVQSAVDGYNVTLFAYGQTGAGKTFTMAGVPGQLGVSPRTIQEVFKVIEAGKDRFEYTVMGSMLELYRQDLVDLLVKGNPAASKNKLKIREDKAGAVTVEHLTEEECRTADELDALVARGTSARAVAATQMNSESSRSHLVLIIRVISVNRETQERLQGKILIVDLAGSERLSKSQTTGDAQKESIEINKSLTALGDVIEGLTKNQKSIPYRNHKLTMLMQDALGGTAKTLMFVNCSPANSNYEETLNSLKYAQRAKNITNQVAKKS
mmetsp:Transcript_95993/g.210051  ORF Transcript_95993/g.210051 Transcript_95993/m.210051 type:complete len:1223 (-) Transcript_95993:564-4232(-)|eukprot:CAMPEP_0206423364 /NCGR_PEP_ID=MMETSP0324_2-20121206/2640_1 /ASSEMBLY_ACC=CAM_ASM_000836 /TAXON_ID=2866 /ORGANISM="Crypthecodinium cohnii, Strain Seligo" /LENGTH=1222 /DNA_ID=CAMNT_0053887917 /DNA_START=89 /DNA_END=3757 /DNA_ORIENTATION=+